VNGNGGIAQHGLRTRSGDDDFAPTLQWIGEAGENTEFDRLVIAGNLKYRFREKTIPQARRDRRRRTNMQPEV
jgi:hypothetical protein